MTCNVIRLVPMGSTDLCCVYREPWMGPHPLCDVAATAMCRAFADAVAQGVYNAQGYTPREWKAKQRKEARP
jgi:hypothetical protein